MKSLSLDSPESSELHGQMRSKRYPPTGPPSSSNYHGGSGGALEHNTPPSNSSRLHCKLYIHILYILTYRCIHIYKK